MPTNNISQFAPAPRWEPGERDHFVHLGGATGSGKCINSLTSGTPNWHMSIDDWFPSYPHN